LHGKNPFRKISVFYLFYVPILLFFQTSVNFFVEKHKKMIREFKLFVFNQDKSTKIPKPLAISSYLCYNITVN